MERLTTLDDLTRGFKILLGDSDLPPFTALLVISLPADDLLFRIALRDADHVDHILETLAPGSISGEKGGIAWA